MQVNVRINAPIALCGPPRLLTGSLIYDGTLSSHLNYATLLNMTSTVDAVRLSVTICLITSMRRRFGVHNVIPMLHHMGPSLTVNVSVAPSYSAPSLRSCSRIEVGRNIKVAYLGCRNQKALTKLVAPPHLVQVLRRATLRRGVPIRQRITPNIVARANCVRIRRSNVPYTDLSVPYHCARSPTRITDLHSLASYVHLLATLTNVSTTRFPIRPSSNAARRTRPL